MELKNRKVMVTGGAGFIGSHLVDRLLENSNQVITYDNFDDFYSGKESNIIHNLNKENFILVRGDLLDYDKLLSYMKKVEVVFHMAAQAGIRYCNDHPLKAHNVNTLGTLNVLEAVRQSNIQKMVYASSSSIFGDPNYLPIDESHPTNPNSPYGATKLAGEKYCFAYNRVYDLNIASLRYFSVYGPRGRPDQVIYKFTDTINKGNNPIIFGDGSYTRDFTFISDVINANILAAESEHSSWETFNIGYGQDYSINEVAKKIILGLKNDGSVKIVYEKSQKGDFSKTLVDNSKARKILGWTPKINLDEGLDIFRKWFVGKKGNDYD